MACEMLEECTDFLASYRMIGRDEIALFYSCSYCHSENHSICMRKRHLLRNGGKPPHDLTPSGYRSMLLGLY